MRAAQKVLIVLALAFAGFNAGGLFAVVAVIKSENGLTATATVVSWAAGLGLAGAVVGGIIAWRVLPERLTRTMVISLIGAAASIGAVEAHNLWIMRDPGPQSTVMFAYPDTNAAPPLPTPGTRDSLIGLVVVADTASFETKEYGYEEAGVTVYGRGKGFYLVGLRDGGRAWMHESIGGEFFPTEKLVLDRLNFLTASWDRQIRDDPMRTTPGRPVTITMTGDIPATVHEAKVMPDGIWIRVDVFSSAQCATATPRTIATGWIPLWGSDAKPTAWFYSRGC